MKKDLIKREKYLERIRPFYDLDVIKVIVGSRRAGKSKIIELIIDELVENGIKKSNIININFEDIDYDEIDDYKKLNDYVKKRIKNNNKYYLFFDEIHHVDHFEKAINSFRATLNCSVFITGSNSKMLSSDISSLLTGRTITFEINPFSYDEANMYLHLKQKTIDNMFSNYLMLGGYPLRFDLDDDESVKHYLNELYESILNKDIFTRNVDIEKEKFIRVARYILINAGNEFNPANIVDYLCKEYGKDYISIQSIYNYIDKMKKCYLIREVNRYSIPGKEILKSMPKYYAIDNGFRIINTNSGEYSPTRFLENLICNELISRGYEVYIGKTYKGEVDFVVMKNNKKCFIQVSYIMESEETINREFGAFSPIKDASPKYVFSLDRIDMSRNGITHINIEDYLQHKVDLIFS